MPSLRVRPERDTAERAARGREGSDSRRRYDGMALDLLMVALDVIVISVFVVLAFVVQWSH
jgi:hypothetical protein